MQAGAAKEFPISVFPGCSVEYSFHTKGGDIGFGILLESPEQELKTVLERVRVDAHTESLNGRIKCTQAGTLWFMWDNTHSWFTAKELVYSVTRQPNDGSIQEKSDIGENINGSAPKTSILKATFKQAKQVDSEKRIMRVILGTMTMASQVNIQDSLKMLNSFVRMNEAIVGPSGLHELDTARMYNHGRTEDLLGTLLEKTASLRVKCSLATKANPFSGYNHNLRPENVIKQLDESLQALKRPSVDIFYLHAPDHLTDIRSTLAAVNTLYREGKFREFGLSNYASWQVMEIWFLCEKHDWIKPTVYQGMYNAITREVEKELFPCLRKLNIRFYAYNPLAGGLLTGRYTSEKVEDDASTALLENIPSEGRFGRKGTKKSYTQRYWKKDYLDAVFAVHNACNEEKITLCAASLRWIVWHSDMSSAYRDGIIIGASKLEHLEENMKALTKSKAEGPLPDSIVVAFDSAWDVCKGTCPSYNR